VPLSRRRRKLASRVARGNEERESFHRRAFTAETRRARRSAEENVFEKPSIARSEHPSALVFSALLCVSASLRWLLILGASIACRLVRSYIRVRALIVVSDHEDPEWVKLDESFSSRHHNRRWSQHSPRIAQPVATRPTCSPHLYHHLHRTPRTSWRVIALVRHLPVT